jgi:hypothetical protein
MGADRTLHLGRLDPHPAHLQLAVDPPEELERAVGKAANPVAAAVPPRAGARPGGEPLRGQGRVAAVAAGDAVAPDPELAGDAHRRHLPRGIDDLADGRLDRPAERDRALDRVVAGPEVVGEREGRRLGRPVAVGQAGVRRQRGERPGDVVGREHVAAGEQVADRGKALGPAIDELVEEAGRQPHRVDPHLLDRRGHGVGGGVLGEHGNGPPVRERPPQLQRRRVEGGGGGVQHHRAGAELGEARVVDESGDVPVRDLDPLRLPGRARGVHHVGEVGGHRRARAGPPRHRLVGAERRNAGRKPRRQVRSGHGDPRPGVGQRLADPGAGMEWVERHIGGARLEHPQVDGRRLR